MRILSIVLLFFSLSVSAQVNIQQQNSPVSAIQASIIKLNQLTAIGYSPQTSIFIEEEIVPLFDFDDMAYRVLSIIGFKGDISPFAEKLKHEIISTLLKKLSQNTRASFRFISAKTMRNNIIAVRLKINSYARFAIYLDLLLHQNRHNQWQIFDIALNDDSLVNYYQKIVLSKIRRYGTFNNW